MCECNAILCDGKASMHFGIPMASGTNSMQIPKGKCLYVPGMSFYKKWPAHSHPLLATLLFPLPLLPDVTLGDQQQDWRPSPICWSLYLIHGPFYPPSTSSVEPSLCEFHGSPVLGDTAYLAVRYIPVANASHQSPVFTKNASSQKD